MVLAGITPPVSVILAPFAAAVSAPVQPAAILAEVNAAAGVAVLVTFAAALMTGYVSLNATALIGTPFVLVRVKFNTDGTVTATRLGLKLLLIVGATGLVTIKFCSVT